MLRQLKAAVQGGLNLLLKPLGHEAHLLRRDSKFDFVLFDRNMLSSYYSPDRNRRLYDLALHKTGMEATDNFSKQCRHYTLFQLVEQAMAVDKTADAAECGCWKGHSAYLAATLMREHGFTGRFHIFDSFEGGLSDLAPQDANERFQMSPKAVLEQKLTFASTQEEVAAALKEFPFVSLYKGWIPERFPEVADRRFSFVHIDVDLYEPIHDSLDFFFPRMVDGGVIVFDDYGLTQFPGAKKAVDEFLAGKTYRLFYESPTGGAFLVK